jgi:hypothetical protein
VVRTFRVAKANQIIAWATPANIVYGTKLSATQLNASLTKGEGALSYSPGMGALLDAGKQALTVSAAETNNFNAATKTVQLEVDKADQVITFAALENKTFGDAAFSLVASSNSGLEVSFEVVSGPATIVAIQ